MAGHRTMQERLMRRLDSWGIVLFNDKQITALPTIKNVYSIYMLTQWKNENSSLPTPPTHSRSGMNPEPWNFFFFQNLDIEVLSCSGWVWSCDPLASASKTAEIIVSAMTSRYKILFFFFLKQCCLPWIVWEWTGRKSHRKFHIHHTLC